MQERPVAIVIVLTIVTFGIYGIVWFVKTRREMVAMGAEIPTAWLIIVPFVNIYWEWKWAGGVELATREGNARLNQVVAFILIFVLGIIGMGIIQNAFNQAIRARMPRVPRAQVVS